MFEVPDVDFIMPCGVVVYAMFYCRLCCVVVSVRLVVCSLSVFLSMCLFVLSLTVLVNWLLNAFAICVGEVTVFTLKVIGLCWCFVG